MLATFPLVTYQNLHRNNQIKGLDEKIRFQRRSVPKFGTDHFCVKCLHRFAEMKPKFTDVLLLP